MRAHARLCRVVRQLEPRGRGAATDSELGLRWSGHGDPSDPFPTQEEAGFPATDDPAAAIAQLKQVGFVVLKGMLSKQEAARHRQELTAHVLDTDAVVRDAEAGGSGEAARGVNNRMVALESYYPEALGLPGRGNFGLTGYVRFAPQWAEIGTSPNIVTDLIAGTMGDDYNLLYTTGFYKIPNSGGAWGPSYHTDGPDILQFGSEEVDVVTRVTCLVMLSEFSAETGATVVIPGSQAPGWKKEPANARWMDESREPESEPGATRRRTKPHPASVQMVGSAGDVAVFDARCFHTGMPNFSAADTRCCVKLRYGPSWLSNAAGVSRETAHNAGWDPLPREIYDGLSPQAKPHLAHSAIWDDSGLEANLNWRDKNPNG